MTKLIISMLGLLWMNMMLSGCVTTAKNAPPHYQFNANAAEGLVAFTATCNANPSDINVEIYEGSAHDFSKRNLLLAKNIYRTQFACNAPQEGMSKPQLITISLPQGDHFLLWHLLSTNYNSVYFNVRSGKLTYIGELNLKATYDHLTTTEVRNLSNRDIPWIKNNLPNIKSSDIRVMLAIAPVR